MRSMILAVAWLIVALPDRSLAVEPEMEANPCARYKWDVSRERALFASASSVVTANKDARSPPRISVERAYQVELAPAAQVVFPVPPGKASHSDGSYSGLLALNVAASGYYRIAVDQPLWIDVVTNGRLSPAVDYEGQHDCEAPRKVVQFTLDANTPLVLQLSGASQAAVRIVVVKALGN